MEKRYDELLTSRLEKVLDEGAAFIFWNELYRWYDIEKIAARTYRDMKSRWEEITDVRRGEKDRSSGTLHQVSTLSGIWIFSDKTLKPFGECEE